MRNRKYVLFLFLSSTLLAFLFFSDILVVMLSGEPFNRQVLETLLRCKFRPDKTVTVLIKREKYIIPLPERASRLDETEIYIAEAGNLSKYLNEDLPKHGWVLYDQMGRAILLRDSSGKKMFSIHFKRFSSSFIKLQFFGD